MDEAATEDAIADCSDDATCPQVTDECGPGGRESLRMHVISPPQKWVTGNPRTQAAVNSEWCSREVATDIRYATYNRRVIGQDRKYVSYNNSPYYRERETKRKRYQAFVYSPWVETS
jgi:hypothetical protein